MSLFSMAKAAQLCFLLVLCAAAFNGDLRSLLLPARTSEEMHKVFEAYLAVQEQGVPLTINQEAVANENLTEKVLTKDASTKLLLVKDGLLMPVFEDYASELGRMLRQASSALGYDTKKTGVKAADVGRSIGKVASEIEQMTLPLQGQCIETLGIGVGAAAKGAKIWCEASLIQATQTQLLKAGVLEHVINGRSKDHGKSVGVISNETYERLRRGGPLQETEVKKDHDARRLSSSDGHYKAQMRLLPARSLMDLDKVIESYVAVQHEECKFSCEEGEVATTEKNQSLESLLQKAHLTRVLKRRALTVKSLMKEVSEDYNSNLGRIVRQVPFGIVNYARETFGQQDYVQNLLHMVKNETEKMVAPLLLECAGTLGKGSSMGVALKEDEVKTLCLASLLRAAKMQFLKAGMLEYLTQRVIENHGKIIAATSNKEMNVHHGNIHSNRLYKHRQGKNERAIIENTTGFSTMAMPVMAVLIAVTAVLSFAGGIWFAKSCVQHKAKYACEGSLETGLRYDMTQFEQLENHGDLGSC